MRESGFSHIKYYIKDQIHNIDCDRIIGIELKTQHSTAIFIFCEYLPISNDYNLYRETVTEINAVFWCYSFFLLLSSVYALFFPLRVLHSFFFLSFASANVCRIMCTSLSYVYVSQLNNRMTMLVCVACLCCLYVYMLC